MKKNNGFISEIAREIAIMAGLGLLFSIILLVIREFKDFETMVFAGFVLVSALVTELGFRIKKSLK